MATVSELVSALDAALVRLGLQALDDGLVPRLLAASGAVFRVSRRAGVLVGCGDGLGG